MAEGKIYEHRAGRLHRLSDVERRGHAERRDSRFFHRACDQSNGLMAYRSCGDEEKCVGVRALELVDDLRREFVADFARRINSTHETERRIDEFADNAGGCELAHPLEREDAVDVALGVASGITEVPHAEFVAPRVNRDTSVRRVLAMEARLIAIHDSAGTDHRDSAFGDGLGERSEWRRFLVDPSVGREIAVEIARARYVFDWHRVLRCHSTIAIKESANAARAAPWWETSQMTDVPRETIIVAKYSLATRAFEACGSQTMREHHPLPQWMRKLQESEGCGCYRRLAVNNVHEVIDSAHGFLPRMSAD